MLIASNYQSEESEKSYREKSHKMMDSIKKYVKNYPHLIICFNIGSRIILLRRSQT